MIKNPKGFGDTLNNFFEFTKIKNVVQAVTYMLGIKDCGCEERRKLLNILFPYGKKRKFIFLKDVTINNVEYKKGDVKEISSNDPLVHSVFQLFRDGYIDEVEENE